MCRPPPNTHCGQTKCLWLFSAVILSVNGTHIHPNACLYTVCHLNKTLHPSFLNALAKLGAWCVAGAQWVSAEGLGQSCETEVSGLSSLLADEAWWLRQLFGRLAIPPQEGTGDKPEMSAECLCYTEAWLHIVCGNENALLWLSVMRPQHPTRNVVFENGEEQRGG